MQRGVETPDMNVQWVSSLSWYFLNLFGLSSVYSLILGDSSSASGIEDMQQMQAMGAPQPMQQPAEVAKVYHLMQIFKSEIEYLDLVQFQSSLDGIEGRIINRFSQSLKKEL